MATYCHSKLLLGAVKVQTASPFIGTSKNEPVLESSRGNGGDKRLDMIMASRRSARHR